MREAIQSAYVSGQFDGDTRIPPAHSVLPSWVLAGAEAVMQSRAAMVWSSSDCRIAVRRRGGIRMPDRMLKAGVRFLYSWSGLILLLSSLILTIVVFRFGN